MGLTFINLHYFLKQPKLDLSRLTDLLTNNGEIKFCSKAQLPTPESLPPKLKKLLENCFIKDPIKRPLFEALLKELTVQKVFLYLKLLVF